MRRSRRCAILYGLAGMSLSAALSFGSQCVVPLSVCTDNVAAFNFTLYGLSGDILDAAAAEWQTNCGGTYSSNFPYVNVGHGEIGVSVYYQAGRSTADSGTCGRTVLTKDSGTQEITSGTISLWEKDGNGTPCPVSQVLEHELGHVYGLDDATGSACFGTIMGAQSYNTTPSFPADTCSTIDDLWYTPQEAADDQYCYQTCQGACYEGRCDTSECFQYSDGSYSSNCYSPIIVDIGGSGFHLTSASDGVLFDLNADGRPDPISWTRDGSNAFLVLDRNGNGRIDDGRELFGNFTPLSDGTAARNGYAALADYDRLELGGNGDGWIDSSDAVWPRLRLWADVNHDGMSQTSELITLRSADVARIALQYKLVQRVDSFGNAFRYKGHCELARSHGETQRRDIYDVYFRRLGELRHHHDDIPSSWP